MCGFEQEPENKWNVPGFCSSPGMGEEFDQSLLVLPKDAPLQFHEDSTARPWWKIEWPSWGIDVQVGRPPHGCVDGNPEDPFRLHLHTRVTVVKVLHLRWLLWL